MNNCSGGHQGTKTQKIGLSFTPLSEKEGRIAKKDIKNYFVVLIP
jgi:hypothetical protein